MNVIGTVSLEDAPATVTLRLENVVLANCDGQRVPFRTADGSFAVIAKRGDIDGNAVLDIFDVLRLLEFIFGEEVSPSDYEKWASDVLGTGGPSLFCSFLPVAGEYPAHVLCKNRQRNRTCLINRNDMK